MSSLSPTSFTVVIVGAGLSGLTAATLLARAGLRVCLVERSGQLGGRAITRHQDGYSLNLGPHALYRGGHAYRILRELDLPIHGGLATTQGLAELDSVQHRLPTGPGSLLATRLLTPASKVEALRFFATLPLASPQALEGQTVSDWLAPMRPDVRRLILTFIRLSTYANAPDRQDAGAALRQLKMAVRSGTVYLDDGWQSLVTALTSAAEAAGVTFRTGSVTRVLHERQVQGVVLATGETIPAEHVLLTLPPDQSARLLDEGAGAPLKRWSERLIPVKAACMDLALRHLPNPKAPIVLGIDLPWYLSVHSLSARLAPPGGAVVHAAWYLDPEAEVPAAELENALETALDRFQPGWRDAVVQRRFMPRLTVTHALDTPEGRPEAEVPGIAGLYLVGDWVGPDGMLADAALASAERAARLIQAARKAAIHPAPAALS